MRTLRLGDVCTKIGSGATPRGGSDVYINSGVALIRSQNVYNDGFHPEGLAFIGERHAVELQGVEVQAGDVLLNITGDSVARACRAPAEVLPARVNQHVAIIRPDPSALDPAYLRYYLVSPAKQASMLSLAGGGATRNALTKGMIENFEVPAPPIDEQRAIAAVLASLDDKIEQNRRTGQTLEGLARATFKAWFVDFEPVKAKAAGQTSFSGMPPAAFVVLPDRLTDSPLGPVPQGWEVGTLGDLLEVGLGGQWGEDEPDERSTFAARCLRGIDCHDLASATLPDVPLRYLKPDLAAKRALSDGVVLVEGSGSFCGRSFFWRDSYASLFKEPVLYTNFTKRLDPRLSVSQALVGWLHMRDAYDAGLIAGHRTGSAFPNLDVKGLLSSFKLAIPPRRVSDPFADMFVTFTDPHHIHESAKLAALRDYLLPRLLSGRVRVRAAEAGAEAVA